MTRLRVVLPCLTLPPDARRQCRRPRLAGCLALLVVLGALFLLGCGDEAFTDATATDLENMDFTFTSGAGPTLAALTGLPSGQAFTLRFGSFGGTTTAPVSLESGGRRATGTVNVDSCTFRIAQSDFPAGQGPQAGTMFTMDSCQINRDNGELRFTTTETETATAVPAPPPPVNNVAFVLTSDGVAGSYAVVALASRAVSQDFNPGAVHSNAVARLFGGLVYVVNRQGSDSIQVIDPQQGFRTLASRVLDVGPQTNPQDIAFVSASKAYVSRLASPRVLIVHPGDLARLGEVDLSPTALLPGDPDGSPEPAFMLVHNGLLYVALRHLDSTASPPVATRPGQVAVIDTATDRLVTVIQLRGRNPASELQFSPTLNRILVSSVGHMSLDEGGIEAINPDTLTVDARFVIDEASLGGDITAFRIISRTKGLAIVRQANMAHGLVTFDPSTGQRLRQLLGPLAAVLPHLAINSRQEVYLSVADAQTSMSGLRIFDAASDRELIATPLQVGALPPAFTLFIE